MIKYSSTVLLVMFVFTVSCSENSSESVSITDLYPLQNGNTWDYYLIEDLADTTNFFVDFETSKLSDNFETALLEIISLETSMNVILSRNTLGICSNFLEETPAEVDLNSVNINCGGLLKYPISSPSTYSYTYSTNSKSYTYNVTVNEERVETDAGIFETFKYSIPSGSRPERDVVEVYFNPVVGLVKLNFEYESGTQPSRVLTLKSTNISF